MADEEEAGMKDVEFYELSYGVNLFFFKFPKFVLELGLSFLKNVPSSDNCPWQVTLRALSLGS